MKGSKKLSGILNKKPSHKNIDSLTGMMPNKNEVTEKANKAKNQAKEKVD